MQSVPAMAALLRVPCPPVPLAWLVRCFHPLKRCVFDGRYSQLSGLWCTVTLRMPARIAMIHAGNTTPTFLIITQSPQHLTGWPHRWRAHTARLYGHLCFLSHTGLTDGHARVAHKAEAEWICGQTRTA